MNTQNYETIQNNGKIIEKIVHISDIHISAKQLDRHDEYRIVFKKLNHQIQCISNNNKSKVLIVITGDIVDNKSFMNPPQISLLKDFLYDLSNIDDIDIVMIIGNHDENPNQNMLNSISPILTNFRTKNNIYLLLESKTYMYNNIMFTVTGMYDKTVKSFDNIQNDIKNNKIVNIALYHGTLHGATTDLNYDLSNTGKFSVTDFTKHGYDFCLLGDVHRFMFMNAEKTVWYTGSLIQQNIGEDTNKGFVLLDIPSKKATFNKIPNDWGFFKINVNKNGLDNKILSILPKYPSIELCYENITHKEALQYADDLTEKYNAKCIVKKLSNPLDLSIDITFGKKNNEKLDDIKDGDTLKKTMLRFIQNKNKFKGSDTKNNSTLTDIEKMLDTILKDIGRDYSMSKVRNFKLKRLEFDNMYKYGEKNVIDFTKMKNIVGIVAPSYSGKSSIISCIVYALFGESISSGKTGVININRSSMNTKIEFSINSDNYIIKRSRTIKKLDRTDSKEIIELLKNDSLINGDDNEATNKKITELFCGVDEFLDVCVMQQMKIDNFIFAKPTERKKILCKLLGLDVLTEVYSYAKSMITTIRNTLPKEYASQTIKQKRKNVVNPLDKIKDLGKLVKDNSAKLKTVNSSITQLKKELTVKKQKFIDLETKSKEINNIKRELSIDNIGINVLLSNIENDIDGINKQKYILETNIEKNNNQLNEYNNRLQEIILLSSTEKYTFIDEKYKKFNDNKQCKINSLTCEKNLLLRNRLYYDEKIINDGIDIIIKSKRDIETHNNNLFNLIKSLTSTIDVNNLLIDMTIDYSEYATKYDNVIQEINKQKEELSKIESDINRIEKSLNKLSDHKFNEKCEYCMAYSITKDKVKYTNELDNLEKLKFNHNEKLNDNIAISEGLYKYKLKYIESQNNIIIANKYITQARIMIDDTNNIIRINNDKLKIFETKINEYNIVQEQQIKNKAIDERIDKIDNEIIMIINEKMIEYEEYLSLTNEIKHLNNDIKHNDFEIKSDRFEIDRIIDKHTKLLKQRDMILNNIDLLKNDVTINKNIKTLNTNIKQLEGKLAIKEKESKKIEIEIIKHKLELDNENEKAKLYQDKIKDISTLTIIVDCLGKDGMVNIILQDNILPKLEENVNMILEYISEYKIKISNSTQGINIDKVDMNDKIIEVFSGCETFIGALAFKLAFGQINNFIKTPFLIMDESFVYCDKKNIDKIPLVFDYIKNNYDFALIISHDDRIIELYDKKIEIKNKNGFSFVQYV